MLINQLNCPVCSECFTHQGLIQHLKVLHNMAITRLIDFFDPRYYLSLIQSVIDIDKPFKQCDIFQIRQSDGVMATQRSAVQDQQLRKMAFAFQRKRALQQHRFESEMTSFVHQCQICNDVFSNITRQNMLKHYENHGLKVGGIDGVVYIEKFLLELKKQVNELVCPCCEQQFKGNKEFKQHLKQKGHLRFNAKRTDIDHFFLTNYREYGKSWRYKDISDDDIDDINNTENFSDTTDQECECIQQECQLKLEIIPHADLAYQIDFDSICQCLFCSFQNNLQGVKQHMINDHSFNFQQLQTLTDVYQRIMQVNYFRIKVNLLQCPLCDLIFSDSDYAAKHFSNLEHGQLQILTDQCYLLPFITDDALLIDVIDEE
ncbi:Rad50 zinc hook motif-containing protein [Spironucleus salmonicida]|uniref:Rad50 zinc hook motif-containing protein n=1 Tax=Spironucleus salmonicida TaxID=348837 RepID=V6LHF4_9EUKA|nr:Rad50 zinc hook motif-containing protein [Spironucleus salmonicida]|eukprot:EST43995.1 Rad50 zinc hook motif-containing protein [Spironucleus salmonicida]